MRYAISGTNPLLVGEASSSADSATRGSTLLVHGTATSTLASRGRVFWLRGLWVSATASSLTWGLADASYSATAAGVAPAKKFQFSTASYLGGVAGTATERNYGPLDTDKIISFPAPGIKFTTNCLIFLVDGSGATANRCGGMGYEE